jgi:tripartite-type tricarboxylate transporter receptor subunit TctC
MFFSIARRIFTLLAISTVLGSIGFTAQAQTTDWPRQPITLVMTFPAGSGVDVVARQIQEPLGKLLGQPIVIDYKPGAAGNIASDFVAHAKPDGYTLVFGTAATHGSNAALYKKLNFDVETDFVPVAPILDVSNVLTINPDVINVKTLKEFVDTVKANPGKFNFASTGNGAGTHMAFAEFNARLGLDMLHVPYKGGPEAITAVLKGETCCIMNQVQTVLSHYKADKVRLLGVTTLKRVPAISEVPTISESGLNGTRNFDSSIWFAVFAPKGTDAQIVSKLNSAIRTVLNTPEIKSKLESAGNSVRIETPEQFKVTVKSNRAKWVEVVKVANISID